MKRGLRRAVFRENNDERLEVGNPSPMKRGPGSDWPIEPLSH